MDDIEKALALISGIVVLIISLVIPSELETWYSLIKGFHEFLIQTLGVSDDPVGFIKLSKILMVEIGLVGTIYGIASILESVLRLNGKYSRW